SPALPRRPGRSCVSGPSGPRTARRWPSPLETSFSSSEPHHSSALREERRARTLGLLKALRARPVLRESGPRSAQREGLAFAHFSSVLARSDGGECSSNVGQLPSDPHVVGGMSA